MGQCVFLATEISRLHNLASGYCDIIDFWCNRQSIQRAKMEYPKPQPREQRLLSLYVQHGTGNIRALGKMTAVARFVTPNQSRASLYRQETTTQETSPGRPCVESYSRYISQIPCRSPGPRVAGGEPGCTQRPLRVRAPRWDSQTARGISEIHKRKKKQTKKPRKRTMKKKTHNAPQKCPFGPQIQCDKRQHLAFPRCTTPEGNSISSLVC